MDGRTRGNQRRRGKLRPILRTVQVMSFSRVGVRAGLTPDFRMRDLATSSVGKIACLLLLVLIAAHVAHLPVLAHGAHLEREQSGLHLATGALSAGHEHELQAAATSQGTSEAALADPSDQGVECMTTAATIPTRTAALNALAVSEPIQFGADAVSFGPACVPAPRLQIARRHLLLQVLLR